MSQSNLGQDIRRIIRSCDRASIALNLSSEQDSDESPYVALVLSAFHMDGSPLLFISDLAEHTKALRENPNCSILLDATSGRRDPLTGARVTLQGTAEFLSDVDAAQAKSRYIQRHTSAAIYASFSDFHVVKINPTRAHLVAGFGKIHWADWKKIGLENEQLDELHKSDLDIIDHMNADHSDVVNLIACKLLNQKELGWQLTGIDPDGCDLRLEGKTARYNFDELVYTSDAVRVAFIQAAKLARASK